MPTFMHDVQQISGIMTGSVYLMGANISTVVQPLRRQFVVCSFYSRVLWRYFYIWWTCLSWHLAGLTVYVSHTDIFTALLRHVTDTLSEAVSTFSNQKTCVLEPSPLSESSRVCVGHHWTMHCFKKWKMFFEIREILNQKTRNALLSEASRTCIVLGIGLNF